MAKFRGAQEDGGQQANSLDPPAKKNSLALWTAPFSTSNESLDESRRSSDAERLGVRARNGASSKAPRRASIASVTEIDAVKSIKRETRLLFLVTSLHGVARIWTSHGKSKAFWTAATLVMAGLMLAQAGILLQNYIQEPTAAQVSFVMAPEGMDFPKITICSNNPIRKSYIEKINATGDFTPKLASYLMLANNDIYKSLAVNAFEIIEDDAEFANYQKKYPNFTINEFYLEAGLSCEDVLKVCSFAGQPFPCCKYSTPVLTTLGLCHSLQMRDGIGMPVMKQKEAAETAGLQILLDSHKDESLWDPHQSIMYSPPEIGFRFYVDEPETSTYSSSQGIWVSPGDIVYSAVSLIRYDLLDAESIGACSSTWPSQYTGMNTLMKYQQEDCHSKCKAKYLFDRCGCSPFVYNIDFEYPSCTPLQNYRCLQNYVVRENGTKNIWPKCGECVTECNKWVYGTSNSYGRGFSDAAVLSLMAMEKNWTQKYVRSNILSMSIFFNDLSYTEYAQVTASNLVQLLSSIGGTFGLFLGMSVLTVFECIIYAGKIAWTFISCQRRRYSARKERLVRKEKEEKEKTVEQIRSLSSMNLDKMAQTKENSNSTKDHSEGLKYSSDSDRSSVYSDDSNLSEGDKKNICNIRID